MYGPLLSCRLHRKCDCLVALPRCSLRLLASLKSSLKLPRAYRSDQELLEGVTLRRLDLRQSDLPKPSRVREALLPPAHVGVREGQMQCPISNALAFPDCPRVPGAAIDVELSIEEERTGLGAQALLQN